MPSITVRHFAFGDQGEVVATVAPEAEGIIDGLEEAFRLTNSMDLPWFRTTETNVVVSDVARAGCRSTSVGDVMIYKGAGVIDRIFQVSSVGFKPITKQRLAELETNGLGRNEY